MVVFEQRASPPQFCVELSGHVTLEEVDAYLQVFEEAITRVKPGFILVSDRLALQSLEPSVIGVLTYLTSMVLRAKPTALIIILDGPFLVPNMMRYLQGIDQNGVLRFVKSREEAAVLVRAYGTSA